jgi:hypothetical protein
MNAEQLSRLSTRRQNYSVLWTLKNQLYRGTKGRVWRAARVEDTARLGQLGLATP